MKRHAPRTEQHSPSQPPRAQHSSERMYFRGNPDSLSGSAEEALSSKAAKVEWMWQLERDSITPSAALTPVPSRDEAVTINGTRPYFHDQTAPGPSHPEEPPRREPSVLEIRYEDDRPSSTLGTLEEKFFDEVMHLVKEQSDATDAENTRHKERIIEINNHYRDKLSTLRAQQTYRRKEFLLKEQRDNIRQHHQEFPSMGLGQPPLLNMTRQAKDAQEVDPMLLAPTSGESLARRTYSTGLQDLYTDRPYYPSNRGPQTQGTETRVPLPAGRVYNTSSRYQ